MMAVINNAYQNSSSSMMQAKFLNFLDDILVTPLSGLEISLAYITGGILRGVVTGISIILMCFFIAPGFDISNYFATLVYIILVSWTFSSIGVIVGVFAKSLGSYRYFYYIYFYAINNARWCFLVSIMATTPMGPNLKI